MTSFGMYVPQNAPFPVLAERFRRAEQLGFDQVWVADHIRDHRGVDSPWYDGWLVLAALAQTTRTIRLGTLVSNPVLRPPALLARMAATLDQLSGGRLELGIGTGIARFDHAAAGVPFWPMAERVKRFAEYVALVDRLLTEAPAPVSVAGEYVVSDGLGISPPPVQRPRPPLTIAGQSPAVLAVAAAHADRWNTNGPIGRTEAEVLDLTAAQNATLDKLCVDAGRAPAAVRRSLLLLGDLDAWTSPTSFERIVDRFTAIGIQEFVVFWPDDERDLDRAVDVIRARS